VWPREATHRASGGRMSMLDGGGPVGSTRITGPRFTTGGSGAHTFLSDGVVAIGLYR